MCISKDLSNSHEDVSVQIEKDNQQLLREPKVARVNVVLDRPHCKHSTIINVVISKPDLQKVQLEVRFPPGTFLHTRSYKKTS